MNLKRKPMEFHNLIIRDLADDKIDLNEMSELNITFIQKGVYATGPVLIETTWGKEMKNLLLPVNAMIEFKEHTEFSFMEHLRVDDGIYYRSGEEEIEENALKLLLEKVATDLGRKLADNYYSIYLNVYGGKIVDIYAPFQN